MIRKLALILILLFPLSQLFAQEVPPLIIEESGPAIRVKPKEDGAEKKLSEGTPQEEKETTDPEKVLVAIVNHRYLTKADLNRRVTDRIDKIRASLTDGPEIMYTLDQNLNISSAAVEEPGMDDEEQRIYERAVRKETGRAVKDWIDHSVLAEEARRQGIIVSEQEFRDRLREAERESSLDDAKLNAFLTSFAITRQEFEKGVYDALMIEKMLERWVQLNVTNEELRRAYEQDPSMFREPERYKIAHFTVALDGSESAGGERKLRNVAEKVQKELEDNKDPVEVFERYNELELGLYGTPSSWYNLNLKGLPPAVSYNARRLEVGETSKVIEQKRRDSDGNVVNSSFHVVKILDYQPSTGGTFESALPTIHLQMLELARQRMLEKLMESGTHYIMTNLRGIPADKIPTPEKLNIFLAENGKPISLVTKN